MNSPSPELAIQVKPLTPDRLTDFLNFFDHDAFTDNPGWASCYCHFYCADHEQKDWEKRDGAENRQAVSQLIRAGKMHGYLAYAGNKVVGWCNAGLRRNIPNAPNPDGRLDADDTGVIVCFSIAPAYRGKGVVTQLLNAALEDLRAQGVKTVQALPRNDAPSTASNYHGPLAMYLNAGFTPIQEFENFTLVRKEL
jgi:ribosomal protein S18 acetylase RimI-like enzyme